MVRLNLASHGDNREGFINVDFDHPSADLKCDVTALPFDNDSVDEILAWHIAEHFRATNDYEPHLSNPLNPKTVVDALQEWYRVLKPGGKLNIKVPDFEKIVWLYYNFPEWSRATGPGDLFGNYSFWINSIGQHQSLFDKKTMKMILEKIGFKNIVFVDPACQRIIDRSMLEMEAWCEK